MSFLQRFLRAWRDARVSATYSMNADEWTHDDTQYLATVLNSATGQKLSNSLRNFVCESAVNATRQIGNAPYHNGVAYGVSLVVGQINNFARLPRNEGNIEEGPSSSRMASLGINN